MNACRLLLSLCVAVGPIVAAGCGGDPPQPERANNAATEASATRLAATTDGIELNADMLAGLERGLRAEIEAVRVAQKRASEANTSAERGAAIQASFETNTAPIGAAAAGLAADRYSALRDVVTEVFRTLDMQGKIDGPLSIDLSRVDEATKQRLSRDPFETLSPASAQALRTHMDRLVPVWIEYVGLTAVSG